MQLIIFKGIRPSSIVIRLIDNPQQKSRSSRILKNHLKIPGLILVPFSFQFQFSKNERITFLFSFLDIGESNVFFTPISRKKSISLFCNSRKRVKAKTFYFYCQWSIIIWTIHLKNKIKSKSFAKSAWRGKVNILRGNVCKTGQLPCILSNIGFCCEFLWRLQQFENLSLPQRPFMVIWWVGDDRT